MIKFTLLILFSIFLGSNAFCREEILAIITNDEDPGMYKLVANTEDATQNLVSFYKDEFANETRIGRKTFPIEELTEEGLVIYQKGDRPIINLKSHDFNIAYGGNITIDTLLNGITGEHKSYEIEITHLQDGWKLLKQNNRISKMHIEVNKKLFIGAIGVKNIRMD